MGLTEPELLESDREVIDDLLARSGTGIDWNELSARGTMRLYAEPRIEFEGRGFATPSGRVELASALAEADGHGRIAVPAHDARPADGRLRLLSPASPWAMNTSFANDPKIALKLAEPTVTLHPEDAARRGLRVGDTVELANEAGSMPARLAVESIVPVGARTARRATAEAHPGWQQRQRPQRGHGVRHRPDDERARRRGDRLPRR